jgi:uncharacterized FAD-dependent dehydrogenase
MSKLIRLEEINLGLDDQEAVLRAKIASILGVIEKEVLDYQIVKKAVDSRKKSQIQFVYSVDVVVGDDLVIKEWSVRHRARWQEKYTYEIDNVSSDIRPVVVGAGPAGLFAALALALAGLKPILIERGQAVEERTVSVANFFKTGKLNQESNVQFGEGGAGTFSDGKLYTLINDPRSFFIFKELVAAGAPETILTSATPHIGTDNLVKVVKNLRQRIIDLGGEIRFGSKLTDLEIKDLELQAIIINNKDRIETKQLVIATGHSARDTYQMLYDRKLDMQSKPFAIGVRIEHLREDINKAQYGPSCSHPKLGTAKYKLVEHVPGERSVYTFCMCPGGSVIAAASELGGVVTNGMSLYGQNNINSNSALLVPVKPEDFDSNHPLAGLDFQRKWEQKAYELGGSDYKAPAQLVGDFLQNKASTKIGKVPATYLPGIKLTSIDACLPDYVSASLRKALPQLNNKIKGFADPEALLTAIETRSSAPLRILRDENCQSNIKGIYPCGEGAGYAGGITSSAIDGLTVAEAIIKNIKI